MAKEQAFDVSWDGPCDCSDVPPGLINLSTNCVLYMICGTHGSCTAAMYLFTLGKL